MTIKGLKQLDYKQIKNIIMEIKRHIVLKTIEEINVPSYDFLTDKECVKILNHALLDLTKGQICWNDIRDGLLKQKHKFGNDSIVNSLVLWVDYNNEGLKITIYKTVWDYYLSK